MYEAHFGLRRRPFRPAPDTSIYYPATSHEVALARLVEALDDGAGIALLTGAPGTGKTLLCQSLLERLGPEMTVATVTNSHVGGRAGLLQAILFDLSLPYEGRPEQEMRLTLTGHLLETYMSGKKAILIVDEAQNLDSDLLEELRLLGNLEARGGKALQIVLSAQSILLERLRQPELLPLAQRIGVPATLEPMTVAEAVDYLLHQVRLAGGKPEGVLTAEAMELLARGTQGIPRRLNQAADQALKLACLSGATLVDAEAALEAMALLGLEIPEFPAPGTFAEAGEATVTLPERAGRRVA